MKQVVEEACPTQAERNAHIRWVMKHKTSTWIPTNAKDMGVKMVKTMQSEYPLDFGPVRYRDLAGNDRITKDPMIIGSLYIIMLEKIGGDWAAVSVPKLQHFGLCAKLTASDKYQNQVREQSTRTWGESEVRLGLSVIGGKAMKQQLMLSTSPVMQRQAAKSIMENEDSMNLPTIVESDSFVNANRSWLFTQHISLCYGAVFKRDKLKDKGVRV